MILPGTLVQRVVPEFYGTLREGGVYTVAKSQQGIGCHVDAAGINSACDAPMIWLCETPSRGFAGAFCSCFFRIIAPPITEADRLEASAPDAPATTKRVRA